MDLTSQNLAFEKTDASVLGSGSSAVVYKGMLDNKPVAIKVRKARMPATLAAVVQLKSRCCRRLSSSKGSPKLRARGSAYRLGAQIIPRSVRAWHMQVYEDMKSELAIMTKPKDPNVLVVYGVYVFRPRRPRGVGGHVVFERCSHLRRAETPTELLLVTDLWDRSARHLLDDRKRRIKVA